MNLEKTLKKTSAQIVIIAAGFGAISVALAYSESHDNTNQTRNYYQFGYQTAPKKMQSNPESYPIILFAPSDDLEDAGVPMRFTLKSGSNIDLRDQDVQRYGHSLVCDERYYRPPKR